MDSSDERTLWCGNLSMEVTEDLLYELFLQAGPLKKVCIPKNPKGFGNRNYGFVMFKHIISAQYAIDLMQGVMLFNQLLHIRSRTQNKNKNVGMECSFPQYHQNGMPRMAQMGSTKMHQNSPIPSSPVYNDLILLDTVSSSLSTLKLPENHFSRPTDFGNFHQTTRFTLPHNESFKPSLQRMDMQQFCIQPFSSPSHSSMLSSMHNPWKLLESRTIVDDEPEYESHCRWQHESHHNAFSPYNQQH